MNRSSMGNVLGVIVNTNRKSIYSYVFTCPGCKRSHQVIVDKESPVWWEFNGDMEKPTFSPSLLETYQHPKGYSNKNPAPIGYKGEYVQDRCHSFITNGMIEFLSDSTHKLAGKTVALKERKEYV